MATEFVRRGVPWEHMPGEVWYPLFIVDADTRLGPEIIKKEIIAVYVTPSGKIWLMEGQKEQALIRRRTLCAASDQSMVIFVTYEHLQK